MTILNTIRHLIEHSSVWVDDAEKAAHLAAVDASELDSLLTRLQAVETAVAALQTSEVPGFRAYQPAHALAPDPAGPVLPSDPGYPVAVQPVVQQQVQAPVQTQEQA